MMTFHEHLKSLCTVPHLDLPVTKLVDNVMHHWSECTWCNRNDFCYSYCLYKLSYYPSHTCYAGMPLETQHNNYCDNILHNKIIQIPGDKV